VAELSKREEVKKIIPAVTSQGLKPEILLNCAGIQKRHPSEKFPDEDWDEVCEPFPWFLIFQKLIASTKPLRSLK
jgi:2-deoxy-D-gluconate 3-dehydrogenase